MYHSEFYKNVVAVTNRSLCERPFLEQIERVCACHPKALILREKDLSEEEYFLLAKEVLGICRQYQVSCILHTYFTMCIGRQYGKAPTTFPAAAARIFPFFPKKAAEKLPVFPRFSNVVSSFKTVARFSFFFAFSWYHRSRGDTL